MKAERITALAKQHATASIMKMIMYFIHCVSGTTGFLPQDIPKENRSWKFLTPSYETYMPKSTTP